MDAKIVCGRIIQEFIRKGYSHVDGYNKFTYLKHNGSSVIVGREEGKHTRIDFNKILLVVEGFQENPDDYDLGPSKTRDYGLTHVNSPVWSLMHLLPKEEYAL